MAKKWIQKAIKHPGALTKTAKSQGGLTKSGKISKQWMAKKLASPKTSTKVKREINLAKTLRSFNRAKGK